MGTNKQRSAWGLGVLAALATVFGAAMPASAERVTARGVVFEDKNGDGVRQRGERGVAGVLVTDSRGVVATDRRGAYEIEIDAEDAIVSVVKPAGFQTALDGQNKPRHFYIHKPSGSRDAGFLFPGVAPTGELPESIDFPLTRAEEEPSRFTAVVFGDPQPYSQEQIMFFRRDVIDPLLGERDRFTFGVSLGDLVGDHLGLFEPLNEAQALLGVPWYSVYGNHDMNFKAGESQETSDDPDAHADETFNRVFGPTDYAFQYGDAHFIVLDNVIFQGFSGFSDRPAEAWPGGRFPNTGNYRGGLREHQIEFVANYLAHVPSDDLVVLLFHIPLDMDGEGVHRVPERRRLLRALSSHPRTLSMSGHTHFQQHWFFGPDEGYRAASPNENQLVRLDPVRFPAAVHHHLNAVTASGSWYRGPRDESRTPMTTMRCGAPNGYTLLHVDGNTYRTEFRAARMPASHQMRLSVEMLDGEPVLLANIFNGATGDDVAFRVLRDGDEPTAWAAMDHTRIADPVYAAFRDRHAAIPDEHRGDRTLPGAVTSHHLWTVPFDPAELPAGTHVVEVRHADLYGQIRSDHLTVRGVVDTLP